MTKPIILIISCSSSDFACALEVDDVSISCGLYKHSLQA